MKKKIAAIILALAAALTLSACSEPAAEPPEGARSTAPELTADPYAEVRAQAAADMSGAVEEALAVLESQPRDDLGTETEPFDSGYAWDGFDDLTEEQQLTDSAGGLLDANDAGRQDLGIVDDEQVARLQIFGQVVEDPVLDAVVLLAQNHEPGRVSGVCRLLCNEFFG